MQIIAAQAAANVAQLRKIAPSLAAWLADECPGLQVADMIGRYGAAMADNLPDQAKSDLTDANKWISLATVANAGRSGDLALKRQGAPTAIFELLMPLITPDQIKGLMDAYNAQIAAKAHEMGKEAEVVSGLTTPGANTTPQPTAPKPGPTGRKAA